MLAVQRPGLNVHRAGVARSAAAGQTEDMPATDFDISKLSLAERIQLAEDLWDSIAAETGELRSPRRRCAELRPSPRRVGPRPDAGEPWEAVRGRLERRLGATG